MKIHLFIIASLIALLTSGCVTGRRTIPLTIPAQANYPALKGSVYLAQVIDARTFMNKPSDPAVPSINGDVTTMTSDQKTMMIGRQRNGYGRAMGDIGLPEGDSVIQVTKSLFEQSLKRRGFALSTDPKSPKSAVVSIDEFWAWFSPGVFTLSFESRVYCTITIKNDDQTTKAVIHGYGLNRGQVASDANWQLAYQRAFDDFLIKSEPELQKAGL